MPLKVQLHGSRSNVRYRTEEMCAASHENVRPILGNRSAYRKKAAAQTAAD